MTPAAWRIVVITDDELDDDALLTRLDSALRVATPGSVSVQLRDKKREGAALLRRAERVAACCQKNETWLLVNDCLDIARLVGAAGVHLGRASVQVADARAFVGRDAIVTVAAHSLDDVKQAQEQGASAVLVSPVFDTPGKGPSRGMDFLASACRVAGSVPVFALGGVDASNAASCIESGAHGVAVIRAIFAAAEPGAALSALSRAIDQSAALGETLV